MPFTIPTYIASQFVKNANLIQRKNALQKSYKIQYMLTGLFTLFHSKEIISIRK